MLALLMLIKELEIFHGKLSIGVLKVEMQPALPVDWLRGHYVDPGEGF